MLDDKNTYLGYYELEDVFRFLQETPFMKEEGGTIILRKEADQFSMSQVAQIVESNNAKVLGLFISDIAIQTFRRYEYEIISEHQEDSYLNSLKERSDYLDKYLNI